MESKTPQTPATSTATPDMTIQDESGSSIGRAAPENGCLKSGTEPTLIANEATTFPDDHHIRQVIRRAIVASGRTQRDIATASAIPTCNLSLFLNGHRELRTSSLGRLMLALSLRIHDPNSSTNRN